MSITRGTSNSNHAASGNSIGLTKPTSLADGDVLVAAIYVRANTSTDVISAPAGWNAVAVAGQPATSEQVAVFYKVVTSAAGEAASYSFTWTGSSVQNAGFIVRYSGVDNTTPSDVAASTNQAANSATATLTGITTATAGAMLIGAVAGNSGTATYSAETSPLTELIDFGTDQSAVFCDGAQVAAGASGDKTATLSAAKDWGSILWALRPASAGFVAKGRRSSGQRVGSRV